MGFFAGELDAILHDHGKGWDYLSTLGVHAQQIKRLVAACEDVNQIASLDDNTQRQMDQELQLTPLERARLVAAGEADTFYRLLVYHKYLVEEAWNKANAVYSASLRDHLAVGGVRDASIYPIPSSENIVQIPAAPKRRRGRRSNADIAAEAERRAREVGIA